MKKNIYMVQMNISNDKDFLYLPYSAGCVAAYALANTEFNNNFCIPEILFRRESVNEALSKMDRPWLVAFSCYIWNIEYNKALAKKIKETYPECIIVFAGHQVSRDASYLEMYPFVDYIIRGEGEEPFTALANAVLSNGSLSSINNISYRDGDKLITTPFKTCFDITNYPSPYLTGLFDKAMLEIPDCDYTATIETNRGCPYNCAFCEWCFSTDIRLFPLEKIKAEIDWVSNHKIEYCACADANFGIVKRDEEIAKHVIKARNITGFPKIFKPCYAKGSNETVFNAGRILNECGADKGVTVAYQTTNSNALENIGRTNLALEKFSALSAMYGDANIPTYTELILGLPGETFDSFSHGICDLLEAGQHNSMTVYDCQVYPNARVGDPEYQKKHAITVEKMKMHTIHYLPNFNGVNEFYYVVVATESMPKNQWVNSHLFSIMVQAFHHLGLVRLFALYLRTEKDLSYYEFYNSLFNYLFSSESTFLRPMFENLKRRRSDSNDNVTYQNDLFGKAGWYLEEGVFLEAVKNFDLFWSDIEPFLQKFYIESDVYSSLLDYQKRLLRMPGKTELTVESDYDFYSFFENIYEGKPSHLKKEHIRLDISLEKDIRDWETYAKEIIWHGKRHSATLCTNAYEKVTVIKS